MNLKKTRKEYLSHKTSIAIMIIIVITITLVKKNFIIIIKL